MRARVASALDFLNFFRKPLPRAWLGMVVERDGRIVAFGGVVWNEHGAAVAFFNAQERVSPFMLHRAVLRGMQALRDVGEREVFTGCDEAIKGAREWLQRLGFQPMPGQPDCWRAEL